ncbi:hypothetical protein P8605_18000 [Streptomyces sp. T-3]|nr:hypothetical protein [Streptomyces sp. T-3]
MPTADMDEISDQRSALERLVTVTGIIALAGLAWALWLAFWPPQHEGKGAQHSGSGGQSTVSCGAPSLFQQSAFRDELYERWWAETSDRFAAACADKADARIRGAVGVLLGTLPFAALWLRSDLTLRAKHAAWSATSRTGHP